MIHLHDLETLSKRKEFAAKMKDGDKYLYPYKGIHHLQYRKSSNGKHCIFVCKGKSDKYDAFVACDSLEEALRYFSVLWRLEEII